MTTAALPRIASVRRLCRTGEARDIRVGADVSIAEVAHALGVSPATVARWETDAASPRGSMALRYGDLLEELRAAAS